MGKIFGKSFTTGLVMKDDDICEEAEYVEDDDFFERKEPATIGKQICENLRSVRIDIARRNGIEFESEECPNNVDCIGTCPKCDAEIEYLTKELKKKSENGEELQIKKISQERIRMIEEKLSQRKPQDIPELKLRTAGIARKPKDLK